MDASTDPDAPLTAVQQQALNQLRDLTNGADDDVAAGVLRAVEWDVQVRFRWVLTRSLVSFLLFLDFLPFLLGRLKSPMIDAD